MADIVIDRAAAGGDVEHVELVDRRRHEQQRNLSHLLGRRLVLDQLENVCAQHDGAGCNREVAAELELARVDRRGKPSGRGDVVSKLSLAPRTRFSPPVLTVSLITSGFDQGKFVGASASITFPVSQPGAALRAPVDVGVRDQAVDGLTDRQIALEKAAKQPTPIPGRVGEAPVASRGCDVRAAPGDPTQLGG
ncbi:MAG TPA: hypothetical protein VFI54_06540 [Solirubrobacteraceae bacterium]|nr:hypothetical protein [Solirubrobacteraceae bacterium]